MFSEIRDHERVEMNGHTTILRLFNLSTVWSVGGPIKGIHWIVNAICLAGDVKYVKIHFVKSCCGCARVPRHESLHHQIGCCSALDEPSLIAPSLFGWLRRSGHTLIYRSISRSGTQQATEHRMHSPAHPSTLPRPFAWSPTSLRLQPTFHMYTIDNNSSPKKMIHAAILLQTQWPLCQFQNRGTINGDST